jgi:hypothetical protein
MKTVHKKEKKKAPEAKLVFTAKLLLIEVSPTPVLDCTFPAPSLLAHPLWLNLLTPFSE